MILYFSKYHGAGNDFILLDNRQDSVQLSEEQVAFLCHRRYGIGADGLMLVQESRTADFKMIYYNADGRVSTFCGNGGRCIAVYAMKELGIGNRQISFEASDGIHIAKLLEDGRLCLSMQDVNNIQYLKGYYILDTGSPHYVRYVENLTQYAVTTEGRKVRNLPEFRAAGINVNFIEKQADELHIRTYERGVEEETYACGTGITAAAVASVGNVTGVFTVPVYSKEGHAFKLQFRKSHPDTAEDIRMTGPVEFVFRGSTDLIMRMGQTE